MSLTRDQNNNISQQSSFTREPLSVVKTVGVAAVRVDSGKSRQTISLQADSANTDVIYVGFSNAVTIGNAGRALAAGEIVTMDLGQSDAGSISRDVFCISGAAAQTLRVLEI